MGDQVPVPEKTKADLEAELAATKSQLAQQTQLTQQAQAAVPPPPPTGTVGRALNTVDQSVQQSKSFWDRYSGLIMAGIGLVVGAIFIVLNNEDVSIDFLFFDWTGSLAVALLVAALCGGLIGWGLERFRD